MKEAEELAGGLAGDGHGGGKIAGVRGKCWLRGLSGLRSPNLFHWILDASWLSLCRVLAVPFFLASWNSKLLKRIFLIC
jgi:hypothetical protein